MSSDEEDYMSDKYLQALEKTDVKPGLVRDRKTQLIYKKEAKRAKLSEELKKNKKPTVEHERARLEEGLSNAIKSDNKGFAMLAKMGYKPGTSIGKSGDGIKEPVNINIKTGRGGLGRETAIKQLTEKRLEIRNRKMKKAETMTAEEFRRNITRKAEEKQTNIALVTCQRTCEQLDLASSVDSPEMKWFWPNRKTDISDDEEDEENEEVEEEEDYEPSEKLEMLTNYLRTAYIYCFWCGTKYTNEDDLNDNCPGISKDDH